MHLSHSEELNFVKFDQIWFIGLGKKTVTLKNKASIIIFSSYEF